MQTVANILPEKHNLIRGNYYRAQIPELWKNNPDRNYNYIHLSLKKAREMKKKKKKEWQFGAQLFSEASTDTDQFCDLR